VVSVIVAFMSVFLFSLCFGQNMDFDDDEDDYNLNENVDPDGKESPRL